MTGVKKILYINFLILCLGINSFADSKFSWDFSDCEIRDIVYAVSLDSGISIVPDDTVSGKSDFRFSGENFETAFDSFLNTSRLYVNKKNDVWTVSRLRILKSENEIQVDCTGLKPVIVFEKLSKELDVNVTYESLPSYDLVFHLKVSNENNLMESLEKMLSGMSVKKTSSGWHFYKSNVQPEVKNGITCSVKTDAEGKVFISTMNSKTGNLLENLFDESGKKFCFLNNVDMKASQGKFVYETFDKALEAICFQNDLNYEVVDDIFYIFSDSNSKEKILKGEKEWIYFGLKYTTADKILPLITKRFGKTDSVSVPSGFGFWAYVSVKNQNEIQAFIDACDIEKKTYKIKLNNIKANNFLSHLPPSFDRNSFVEAEGNAALFYTGTEDSYKKVLAEVSLFDVPQKRLKYDLLILQYDDTSDNMWASNFSAGRISKGDINTVSAKLGNVLGYNLNVLTAFGLEFSHSLQTSIAENKSRVFADTSLHGLAGKEINFSNTNTYRYRDNNLDPETGKPVYSGVTREIVSGLKLDITGWVGNDGVITSSVKASVSRRGTDSSAVSGNPPPTTEKIVTTEVSGKSGEPIVLSGLISESEAEDSSRSPLISKIPFLGRLFKSEKKTKEKSQMVIYLVPFIEGLEKGNEEFVYDENWLNEKKERLCKIMNSN